MEDAEVWSLVRRAVCEAQRRGSVLWKLWRCTRCDECFGVSGRLDVALIAKASAGLDAPWHLTQVRAVAREADDIDNDMLLPTGVL